MARVFDTYLYQSDVENIIPKGIAREDSIILLKKYIDTWIRETLVIRKAEKNLSDIQKDVQKQLQSYRNSLITYAYEKELVRQSLDTFVTDDEIEKYYNSNKGNFELKDNIIKVLYIKIDRKAPNIEKVKKWYKSDNLKDRKQLEGYCYQFAKNYYLNDETWLFFDDLLKEIPIQTYNKEMFLQNNRFVETQDSSSYYFVNIKGFKIKNSLSPLSFEKDNIKKIILNKRKLQLINDMKEGVYKDAEVNKDFELY